MTLDRTRPAGRASAPAGPDILCSELVRIFTAQGIEVQALQGLELRVERGEMVALVGASGSGKSTLLTILAGLDTPTAGSARVAGHDLVTMRGQERLDVPAPQRRIRLAAVGAQPAAVPQRRREHRRWRTPSRAWCRAPSGRRSTDELLELLDGRRMCADRRPDQLSGGQKQRVAIAVALANGPRVLLADEPTGELDEATSADVLAAMETVNQRARRHDADRHPRPRGLRARRPHGPHPRRPHLDRDAAQHARRRRGPLGAGRRGVRGARPGRPHAAARRVHGRPRAARSRAARARARPGGGAAGRPAGAETRGRARQAPRARERGGRMTAVLRAEGVTRVFTTPAGDVTRRRRRRPRGGVGRAGRDARPVGLRQDDAADDARAASTVRRAGASSSTAATSRPTAATSPACWAPASHPCSRASG